MTVPISGYLAASGGGSHLSIGGEMATEKEASVDFFLLIGGREREGVVLVPHVGDGHPTACQSGGNAAQHRSPVPGWTRMRHGQFEANPGHCSTGLGPNH
jgi:hypothetical protein